MEKTLQPKLRFKEFSGEWEMEKLNSLVEPIKRNTATPLEVLTISAGKGFITQKERFSQVIAGKSLDKYTHLKKDEFSYNRGNSKQFTYGCIYRLKNIEEALVPNVYRSFSFNNGIPKFYEQLFLRKYLDRQLRRLISSSARMDGLLNIGAKDFYEVKVPVTSIPEQEKIASFLSSVDSKIEKLEKKRELLGEYKKGVMQKIFSQKIRFKDESGNEYPQWEEKKLGELCNIKTGKLDANAMVENGKYRFYTCAKEYSRIDNYAFDTDALLISGNGANVGYIHHYKGKFNAYQRTYVLDKFEANIKYIRVFLEKNLYKRILQEKNEGNTPYIVLGTLRDMNVNFPCLEEQEKIADFLSSIGRKIESVEREIDRNKEFKKGLLQQMFV